MTTKYVARVTQVTVLPEGKPLFDETATTISIEDEAGGEFVTIKQYPDGKEEQAIRVYTDDWPMIRKTVDELIKHCKSCDERK